MTTEPTLEITLDAQQLERHCAAVLRTASDPARVVAAFAALRTFLADVADPGQQAGEAYRRLREVLDRQLAEAERRLRADYGRRLTEALAARSPEAVAAIHGRLSRSGFAEVLAEATTTAPAATRQWAETWLANAERRAAAASGYPDALDFAGAGIALATYAAMKDLTRRLAGWLP